jgi:hypothetical protein
MTRDEIEQAMHDAGLMMPRTMVHRLRTQETAMLLFAGPRAARKNVKVTLDRQAHANKADVASAIAELKT